MSNESVSSQLSGLSYQDKANILLDLAKLGQPTLDLLGMEPGKSPIFVMDTSEEIAVGTEIDVLKEYAKLNGLEFVGPLVNRSGEESVWEVSLLDSGRQTVMFSGGTEEECREAFLLSMREMAGTRVGIIGNWSDVHAAGSFEDLLDKPEKITKERPSQFVTFERVQLIPLPISKLAASELSDLTARKVRRKQAYEMITQPMGMGSQMDASSSSGWNIPVMTDETGRHSNHHDILSALRLGLDVSDINPWPNDIAHRFLVLEELRKVMKGRGYVELSDFDERRIVRLRTSLPEFTPELTGDKPPKKEKPVQLEKPVWPPVSMEKQRVVIAVGRARLAYETEPEWEVVSIRDVSFCAGHYWVETSGPVEKKRSPKKAKKD